MAEENEKSPSISQREPSEPVSEPVSVPQVESPQASVAGPSIEAATRSELISRARSFLSSPQIQSQDIFAKRRFLVDKGLNETEIELLLRELPPQLPRVPPRTYPQPPPSGLLTLLIGFAKIFTWIAGGSATLLFLYHRFLLPRILRTAESRKSLKIHQVSLLKKLNASLKSLKETQTQCYALLPRPDPHKEPSAFAGCHSLLDVLTEAETHKLEISELPHLTLLRCAWEDFRKLPDCADSNPRTEELFQVLESRIPWLVSAEGVPFERNLWEVLSTTSVFNGLTSQDSPEEVSAPVRWAYIPPKPAIPTPFLSSLESLSSTVTTYQPQSTSSPYQYTLQAMSEFTGYISSNLYTPYRPPPLPGTTAPSIGEPADELKKEIRALKGLVLNRRSFMPTIPRVNIPTGQVP
ncbi:hypothetical protein GGU10DRAFT_290006 [Lentinula aff. detonsa]|uniref:Peroxisome membrane anchor protein Pex14p N-terminal domain-containing protein n=1 Tax=Lentinula aff. detonsa TaxID=2804958 RepID=A0AA38KGY3_9AGAR|nr:hypothetical protein GGU10DRAFT_290006 [Lentinula aff. detonsa]